MSAMNDAATRGLWAQALLLGLAIGWLADAVEAAPGRWSSAGPYGGRIDSAALSPLEPGVVYASAHRSVYRSDDGGNSWSNQSAGLSTLSAGTTRLAAHPALPGYVLLAGARGVFLSVNSGRSWFRRDSGLPVNNSSFHTVDVAYAPSNPAVLYLASEDDGLYRSSNGGASWVAVGAPSLPTDLIRIAVDPGDAQSLLVWVGDRNTNDYPASLYRSSNGGLSFTPVSGPWDSGGPIREDIQLLAYNANTPGTVFLAGDLGNFRSTNGGTSFSALPALPLGASQRLQSLAYDPGSAGRLVFGSSDGVLLSLDNGASFLARNSGLTVTSGEPASIGTLLIDPANAARWLAFGVAGEVFLSANAGLNWAPASGGLRGTGIQTLAVHPTRPQRVYAGLRNRRHEATSPALYQSDDGAQSWVRFNAALALDTVNAIAFDPATVSSLNSTRMYAIGADFAPLGLPAASYRGGVFRSNDGGVSWTPADNFLPTPLAGPAAVGEASDLLLDPASISAGATQILYLATRGLVRCVAGVPQLDLARLWRSSDAASSWLPRDGLPLGVCTPRVQYPLPAALAFDPGDSSIVYAGTRLQGYCQDCGDPLPSTPNGVYKSIDGGLNWVAVNSGLPLMSGSGSVWDVAALAAAPGLPGTLYVALNDASQPESAGRVYKTVDGGASWQRADTGLAGVSLRSLRVDPGNPQRVLAGVGGLELTPGGIYLSSNGGASWDSISIDLPIDSAQAVALSLPVVGPPTIHAGTDEGVFSLTRIPDGDVDGPPDATEDLAPNAGDGNADAIADRLQPEVASFEIPNAFLPQATRGGAREGTVSNTELSIGEGSGCTQVYDAAAVDPLSLPDDGDYQPAAGVVRFEFIGCTQLQVGLIFHGQTFGPDWVLRRYGPTNAGNVLSFNWFSPSGVTRTGSSWNFTLIDNGAGDLRRETGRILFIGAPMQPVPLHANGFE